VSTARLECITPILRVSSLQASLDYYVGVLGFTIDWHDPAIIASVSRDGFNLMLAEGDQGNPGTWVWIGVNDSALLFNEFRAKGATIRLPPTNYPWAYEMQVTDPNGNVLRFGSEPLPGQAYGAWRDMQGTSWTRRPEGGWTRVDSG